MVTSHPNNQGSVLHYRRVQRTITSHPDDHGSVLLYRKVRGIIASHPYTQGSVLHYRKDMDLQDLYWLGEDAPRAPRKDGRKRGR